jgi:hypothetical protein
MRRRIALVVAAVCAVGAVVLAVLPYTSSSEVEVADASNEAPDADGNFLNLYRITTVEGRRRPPVISAWRKDGPDDEGLWAITVGTSEMGYAKATAMGRLCAHSARKRLLGSLGLGVLGVGAVLIGRRIQPPAASPGEPSPS